MAIATTSRLNTLEGETARQPPCATDCTPARRVVRALAGILVLLLLGTILMACGPAPGSGCRRASSSMVVTDLRIAPIRMGTLIGPVAAHAKPAKEERRFNCSKQESRVWQQLESHKGSIKTNGKKGKKARFYQWDHTHNDIEEYGPKPGYQHLGSLDPINGRRYKGPVEDRDLKDELK